MVAEAMNDQKPQPAAKSADFYPMPPISPERQQDESIGMALRQARKRVWGHRGSLTQVSDMVGVSPSLISLIERGHHSLQKVRSENLEKFPEAYGMSAAQFAHLTGITLVRSARLPANTAFDESLLVPVYSLGQSTLGPAELVGHEYISNSHAVPGLLIVEVVDEAMAPDFGKGSRVYVDRESTQLIDGKVYLVQTDEGHMLRRVRTLGADKLLMADNQAYAPALLGKSTVLGRANFARNGGVEL